MHLLLKMHTDRLALKQADAPMKPKSVAALLLVALVVACAWLYAAMQPGKKAEAAQRAVPVLTGVAELSDASIHLDGLGTVQPFNSVLVRSRVDGQLDKVLFVEGRDVRNGDALAQIDPQPFAAQLRQAQANRSKDEAQLGNLRTDLARYASSIHRGAVPQQVLDTTKAQVAQLEAQVQADAAAIDNARVQLGYTTIRSPIDGRTGVRQVDPGNLVRANDTGGIVSINQIHPIAVVFSLPAESLRDIRAHAQAGELAVVALSRDGSEVLATGKLALVDNQIDTSTATIKLKAAFANDDDALWPGQFVNARLILETRKNTLTVPALAVQHATDGDYAFVVKPGDVVERRALKTAAVDGARVVVASGLRQGERVVLEGQYKLEDGSRVSVTEAK